MTKYYRWYFFFVIITEIAAQNSPCPNLFRYENDGGQWHGILRIPSGDFGTQITLVIKMSIGAQLPTSYVGSIQLVGNDQEVAQIVESGGVITYKVNFPLSNPIPKLTSVEINGRQYCSGPPEEFTNNIEHITSINLDHTLFTSKYGISGNKKPTNTIPTAPQIYQQPITTTSRPQIYQQVYATTRRPLIYQQLQTTTMRPQIYQPPSTTRIPAYIQPTASPSFDQNNYDIQICGRSKVATNALIKGGENTERGDWPWVTALLSVKSGSTKFICSGSLISNIDIVTAAHCVPTKKGEKLLAKLGLHNINEWNDDIKIKNVDQMHIHPNFNRVSLHNDIAILKISRIEYTVYIQPICFGISDINYNTLVGRTGTVVGWGKDEYGNSVTPDLKKSTAKVSSTEECQRNDPRIIPFTSSTTMCAGNNDGTGPCNGDSGGGLYFYLDNRWHIRGIVSNSLPDKETGEACGLREHVLYTDISKYSNWVNSIKG
ncbi:serine protease gd-like [Arctopsyche grandis]|uniref:serine protease gd-like n=1 Tax=Arctopsyche grandis TaxID=121162 RepID=UPI00406D8937